LPTKRRCSQKTRTSAFPPEIFTLRMNMTRKGESPCKRHAHADAHANFFYFFLNFVNEVIPFFTSRPSSPRFRIQPPLKQLEAEAAAEV
jgi:hypothetical protein